MVDTFLGSLVQSRCGEGRTLQTNNTGGWSTFTITILNSLSGRLFISSSFIWSCEFLPHSFICALFLCLLIIFFLTRSTWGLLFPDFMVVFLLPFGFCLVEGNVDWVICVDFLLRVTCFCLLVGGNQANQEVITEIMRYIHTLPHIQL